MATDPVSVVMPTRDRWVLATLALESVLAQEGVALEVIVVDDGSSGEAFRPVEDPRVRVLRSERSEGVARARDRGLRAARHPWVAFLDDDDLWSPDHLRSTLAAANDEAAWAYAAQLVIDGGGRTLFIRAAPPIEDIHAQLVRRNTIGTPSAVIARTELVRSIGSFDATLSVLADWDLWLRLAERSAPGRSGEPTVAYRRHPGNMHLRIDEVLAELERLRARHGGAVGSDRFTTWVADGYRERRERRKAAAWYVRSARERRRWSDLLRAGGVFLGESFMTVASSREPPPPAPAWVTAAQRRQATLEGLKRTAR